MPSRSVFSGSSSKGDLGEAVENAVVAAHAGLRSELVTWRLEGLRGTSGGFVGARNVTATVEASTPGAKDLALKSKGETRCVGWHAWHDRMPGREPALHVVGVCTFPTAGYTVTLRPAKPQGFNPAILIFDKIVTKPTGPVAQVVTDVPVHYQKRTARVYTHVQIMPEGTLVPVETVY